MRGFWLFLLLAALAQPLAAGPWPRERGHWFSSGAMTLGRGGALDYSAWLEVGLGRGRQLMAEARMVPGGETMAALMLQRPLPDLGAWKQAWSLGVAVSSRRVRWVFVTPPGVRPARRIVREIRQSEAALRLSYSLGRGLRQPWPGWTSLELRGEVGSARRVLKADATLGYRPRDWLAVMLALQAEHSGGRSRLHIAPSAVWFVRPGIGLELGLRQQIGGGAGGGQVKLGSWIEF